MHVNFEMHMFMYLIDTLSLVALKLARCFEHLTDLPVFHVCALRVVSKFPEQHVDWSRSVLSSLLRTGSATHDTVALPCLKRACFYRVAYSMA